MVTPEEVGVNTTASDRVVMRTNAGVQAILEVYPVPSAEPPGQACGGKIQFPNDLLFTDLKSTRKGVWKRRPGTGNVTIQT